MVFASKTAYKPLLHRKPIKLHRRKKNRYKRKIEANTVKLWRLKRADVEFRLHMLNKVPHKCVFPGCEITDPKKLTVSHYFGRAKKGTRFLLENCDFICRNHHYWDKQRGWEFQKQRQEEHGWDGQYTLYMKNKLGNRFTNLEGLANSKMSPKEAIKIFMSELNSI